MIEMRPAALDDAAFLSWAMLPAGWAHVKKGIGDVIVDRPERECAESRERLAVTRT
ncbi:MAG: hypothetical protein P8182_18905 [Deltaproteobacteria bacterium]